MIASIARLARQTRAISVPLLATGLLAAACGTTHAAGTGAPGGGAATGTTAGQATSSSPSAASPSAAPTPHATPVPTVTGGATTGWPACVGWPTKAPRRAMTAAFKPVAVERCVTGFTKVPGKGEWETATMEKATKNLEPLVAALLLPSAGRTPGTVCPYLSVLPPQIVLTDAAGRTLIPLLPLSGCGEVATQVYVALNALRWQPVSVRLVAPLKQSADAGQAKPGSPKTISTLPAVMATGHVVTTG